MSQPLRVLVADDEPLIRVLVAIAFEEEGYDAERVAEDRHAVEAFLPKPFGSRG